MNFDNDTRPFVYANQHEAEARVVALRDKLGEIVTDLEKLAEETDSHKLHGYAARLRRQFAGFEVTS